MATKKYYSSIQLMGTSVIMDESGNQVSISKDEKLGISNASGGPLTATNPVVSLDKFNQDLDAIRSGIRWRDPVDTVVATAPLTPTVGQRYINSTDWKLYNCKVAGTWVEEVASENWTVFAKDTDEQWTYDEQGLKWVMRSSGNVPYATDSIPGIVELATDGEVAANKVVQSNDSRLVKGYHYETLSDVNGTVTVTHGLNSSHILVQTWSTDASDFSVAKNATDASNKLDISTNSLVSSVEVCIIALP
jgi:hypothetical protein